MATTPVNLSNAASQTADTTAATNAALNATDPLGNEDTFLQLLVSQIQNQDPTAPMDSTTFLTQLASFSQLEQLIAIQQDVAQLDPTTGAAAGSTANANSNTSATSATSGT
jgi:flagellar basal-body rod modification protein FlgD